VPAEPDKNGDAPPGVGLVPANVSHGVRVNAAMAYVLPHRDRRNLTVRGDCGVARVVVDGDRAVGVETLAGERIEAGEVVLAAGAIATPQLLALSGIGPADELRAVGVRCTPRRSRRRPRSTSTPGGSTPPCPPTPRGTWRCCSSPGPSPPAAPAT
jgi:choline dehydrogenase-like flavoprotein